MSRLSEMRQQRLEKLQQLRQKGLQPYPASSHRSHQIGPVVESFAAFENTTVTLAGRLMSLRDHRHVMFGDLIDETGKIQLYIKEDVLSETLAAENVLGFSDLRLVDPGDIIEVTGTVTKTARGEISLLADKLRLLTKSLRPLPDSWEGLKDPEYIFRHRYLDLLINPESRRLFERKAKFWQVCRDFMREHDFIEVETPVLEHVTGGADARPFVTHMNALDQDLYMRISTELFQKRLIGGGFEKVYTLGPNFRNEGLSDEHLPEFYQLEWYWAYADYRDNMTLVKELFRQVAQRVYGKTDFIKGEHHFDLADEWTEISYPEIIKERLDVDIFEDSDEKMRAVVQQLGIKLDGLINRQRLIDNLWKSIRKTLSGPAFLVNEPKFMSPLAKSKVENPELTERFHVILAGSELGNGYSELNDPIDQLERFQEQQAARNQGDDEAQMMDLDFVEMLEYGMPPTSGYGQSERVFWFLENITAREGTLFPQLKYKVEETSKEIYCLRENGAFAKKVSNLELPETETTALATREEAEALLEKFIENPALRHHAKMVATALAAYAQVLGQDEELWYQSGLLHDLDWEKYPDEHPNRAISEILKNYPREMLHAIAAHAPARTGVTAESLLDRYLFACDELSGFLHAVSLMRPNGFADMKVTSVKKKLKDKSFAANVSREDIQEGFRLIEKAPEEHIQFLIDVFKAMRPE
jgi:lysyl-tRNA synthetase class 2